MLLPGQIRLVVADKIGINRNIRLIIKQQTFRRQAVTPCASCLLIIAFDILGHIIMHYKAYIRLINTHTEGICRHNQRHAAADEGILVFAPLLRRQTCVIAQGTEALAPQKLRHAFHLIARSTVNYAAILFMLTHKLQQRALLILRALHGKMQIGPVKARHHNFCLRNAQTFDNITAHIRRSRRSKGCHQRLCGQGLNKIRNIIILLAETVSPLRYAVRLVHRHHRNIGLAGEINKLLVDQALRCHIQKFALLVEGGMQHSAVFVAAHAAVQISCRNTAGRQRLRLILHQRYQR